MQKYRAKGPDGRTYEFSAPEGLNEREASALFSAYADAGGLEEEAPRPAPEAAVKKPETGFIPSVKRGYLGVESLLGDVLPGMVAKGLGFEQYGEKQMQEAAEAQKRIQEQYPAEVPSYTDIKTVGDAFTYLKESIGEALPSILPSLVTGGGATLLSAPAQAAARQAALTAAKRELMKDSAKAAIQSGAYGAQKETLDAIRGVALEAGAKAAQTTLLKYQATGALTGSAALNIPEVYQNILEETGKEDLGAALVSGGFNAALDAVTPMMLLRKATRAGVTPEALIGAWYKRAGVGAVKGFVTEGGTEAIQEASSIAAENFVAENANFFNQKNFERMLNAGIKGGLGGGAITAAADVAFGKAAPKVSEADKRLAEIVPEEGEAEKRLQELMGTAPVEEGEAQREGEKFVSPLVGTGATVDPLAKMKEDLARTELKLEGLQAKGVRGTQVNNAKAKIKRLKQEIADAETAAQAQPGTTGAPSVDQSIQGAGGTGVPVPVGPDTGVPAPGAGGTQPSGVVPAGPTPPTTAAGEAAQPSAVTKPKLTEMTGEQTEKAWKGTDGRIHYTMDATLPNGNSRVLELIEQEQDGTVALRFEDSKGNKDRILTASFAGKGKPYWFMGDASEETIRKNIGDELYNSLGDKPITSTEEYAAAVQRIKTALEKLQSGTKTAQAVEAEAQRPEEPTPEQRAEALKTALADLPRPEAPGAGKRLAKLKRDQIGRSYDENRELVDSDGTRLGVLPKWEDLRSDAQDVYLDRIVSNTPDEQRVAKTVLGRYLNELSKLQGVSAKKDLKTAPEAAAYELNRTQYEKSLGVRFPTWDNLSNDQRDLFGSVLTDDTTEAQDAAFQILGGDLQQAQQQKTAQKAQEPPVGFSSYEAAQQRIAQEQQDKQNEQARKEKEREEMLQRDPWKTDFTPSERTPSVEQIEKEQRGKFDKIRELVKKGNINGVLTYVGSTTTLPIYKTIASRLIKLSLNTKTQFVESLPNDQLAIYDPKTDTIQITERGLRNVTLLHEAVHAATVKVINKYLTGKSNELTPDQLQAVMQLEAIRKLAERRLGRKLDLYEFVSEALTDRVFQRDISRLPATGLETVYMPETKSLWTEFTLAMARGLGMLKDLFKPGKKGELKSDNVLMEVFGAFEDILAVPDQPIDLAPLPMSETKQATEFKTEGTPEQIIAAAREQVQLKEHGGKAFIKNLMTQRGYDWFVTHFQNDRRAIKNATERAQRFGILQRVGDEVNDVYGQITRSTGIAVNMFNYHIKNPSEDLHAAIEKYAQTAEQPIKTALADLHLIFESFHEPERRRVKYLKSVPLDDNDKFSVQGVVDKDGKAVEKSAAGWRQFIFEELAKESPALSPTQMRDLLNGIVLSGAHFDKSVKPELLQESNPQYNVIAGRTPAQIAAIRTLANKHPEQVKAVREALQALQKKTQELNKQANYWSTPVQNIVDFYGYKDYVPFKGRPGSTQLDDELDLTSKRIGGDLQDFQGPFEGRISESENPLLQSLAEAAGSALRLGRKDLTLAIKNAAKDNIVQGKQIKTISFRDRYLNDITKTDLGGPDKIFHYNADGTIDIIEIRNKEQLESIRRSYRTSQPLIDIANMATSFLGQMHTRYNPAFAPMNFVRDVLTNAFTLGAELGPRRAGQLLSAISADVASGGMYRALQFSRLYSAGNFQEIEKLSGKGKNYENLDSSERYYRDMLDYIELGGKVSYLQGVAAKGALDGLIKEVGRSGILRSKDQVDTFFDVYNDIFEMASRVSTYRMLKDEFVAEGEKLGEAMAHAAEYTKNLANFEQVGRWGKAAGAAFMFFRPAATGAVRAIDALRPAFGFNEETFIREAKQEGRTDEQIQRALAEMRRARDSARVMAAGLAGVGAMLYMAALAMAGDDEEGRNRVATDDMARWTRYARFHIPGTDTIIQIPWGFGLGSFAAAGAQIASLAGGRNSFKDAASNIFTVGMDSFLPIPVSRISPMDNFPAWALDSITPSAFRPFFEYVMNIDGLGREIYNNRQTRYGDAYTGGDNIPEMYKMAARGLFDATQGGVDWSPNTMYFFANNYIDGLAKIVSAGLNAGLTVTGQKEFSAKNDLLFVSSFVGTKSNVDAREYSKAEEYIKGVERRINSLKDKPELFSEYVENNPNDLALVQFYNQQANGSLRQLRAAANQIRANKDLSISERKAQLEQIVNLQNQVKRQILNGYKDIAGYEP
jgi:hypothetical protein